MSIVTYKYIYLINHCKRKVVAWWWLQPVWMLEVRLQKSSFVSYRNATIFCVNFTFANFASPYKYTVFILLLTLYQP